MAAGGTVVQEMTCNTANVFAREAGVLSDATRCIEQPIAEHLARWASTCCAQGTGLDICNAPLAAADIQQVNISLDAVGRSNISLDAGGESEETVEVEVVQGEMTLTVEDPEVFASDPAVASSLRESIADMAGPSVTPDDVEVNITVVDGRRLSPAVRRLAGGVRVDYTIRAADAEAAESLATQLTLIQPEAMAETVNAGLASAGIENAVSAVRVDVAPVAATRTVPRDEEPSRTASSARRIAGSLPSFAATAAVLSAAFATRP